MYSNYLSLIYCLTFLQQGNQEEVTKPGNSMDVLLVEDPNELERCGGFVFKSFYLFQLILNGAPQLQCLIPKFGDAILPKVMFKALTLLISF